jgi:hypothetical protein
MEHDSMKGKAEFEERKKLDHKYRVKERKKREGKEKHT